MLLCTLLRFGETMATPAPVVQPAVRPLFCLGYRPQLNRSLAYLSDSTLLISTGARTLARLDVESLVQSQVCASAESVAITALAISPDLRTIAWAEYTHDGRALVLTGDLEAIAAASDSARAAAMGASALPMSPGGGGGKASGRRTRKTITSFESTLYLPITALSFTSDSRHLLIPSAAPEVTLHYIAWESGAGGRLVASAKGATGLGGCPHPVLQMDCNPRNPHHFAITGTGNVRHFFWIEGNEALAAQALHDRSDAATQFTCHTWLPDEKFVVGTAAGDLLVYEGVQLRKKIAPPRGGPAPGALSVAALLSYGANFIAGCDGGVLRVYEKNDTPGQLFEITHAFAPPGVPQGPAGRVVALAASPGGEDAAVGTANGGIFHFPLGSFELAKKAAISNARAAGAEIVPTFPSLFSHVITPLPPHWVGAAAPAPPASSAPSTALARSGGGGSGAFSTLSASAVGAALTVETPSILAGTLFAPLAHPALAALTTRPPPPRGTFSLSTALHRPLLATISADKVARIWNITGARSLEIGGDGVGGGEGGGDAEGGGGGPASSPAESPRSSEGGGGGGDDSGGPGRPSFLPGTTPVEEYSHSFSSGVPGTLLCTSLHPLGDTLLISSDSSVTQLSLRLGGAHVVKELPLRGVGVLRFSTAGGLWACSGTGGNISIYSTYTGTLFGALKGGHKEPVVALAWGPEDRALASVSRDGTVCLWGIRVPNAVSGGAVPCSARAVTQHSGAVTAESLKSEGMARTPTTALSCKLLSRVENPEVSPTALCFGGVEAEVILAGIIKEGAVMPRGAKVSFSGDGGGGGGGGSTRPAFTGPVLVALQMLLLADGASDPGVLAAAAAAAPSQAPVPTPITAATVELARGAAAGPKSPTAGSSSAAPGSRTKRGGAEVGGGGGFSSSGNSATLALGGGGGGAAAAAAPPAAGGAPAPGAGGQPPPMPTRIPPKVVIPIAGSAPIHALHAVTIDASCVPGMAYPVAMLFAGMGHRISGSSDTELRARASSAIAGALNTISAPAADTMAALAGCFTSHPDPVGSLRVYRLPLLSPATSGVPFGLFATAADAAKPVHPYGFFERGGQVGHSGPCVALSMAPGDMETLYSSGADGSIIGWKVSPSNMWANMERAGTRVLGNDAGSGGGGGSAASAASPSLASEAVNGFARHPPGAVLGACSVGGNWVGWAETNALPAEALEKIHAERRELEARLVELSSSNKHAERLREIELGDIMAAAEEKYQEELVQAREGLEAARIDKVEVEARGEQVRLALEAQESEEEAAMKALYASKLAAEDARLERRALEKAAYSHRVEEEMHALAAERARELEILALDHADALAAARAECEQLEEEVVALSASGKLKEGLLEGGLDADLETMRAKLEQRVAEEAHSASVLKGENGALKRHFGGIVTATEEVQAALEQGRAQENELESTLKSLEKDYSVIVKDLRERDALMDDKDSRIAEIRMKNQELEKFKFVLNYKIQELKRAVMPRKRQIVSLRATLSEMEIELLQLHKSSSLLSIMIDELKLKRKGLVRTARQAAAKEAAMGERLANIQRDVASMGSLRRETQHLLEVSEASKVKPSHSPGGRSVLSNAPVDVGAAMAASASAAQLRSVIVSLYQKYILGEVHGGGGLSKLPVLDEATGTLSFPVGVAPDEVAEEVMASRGFLESAVAGLRVKIEKDSKLQAKGAVRLTAENTALLQEVNELRRGLRYSWGELLKARAAAGLPPPEPEDEGAFAAAMRGSSSSSGGEGGEEDGVPQPEAAQQASSRGATPAAGPSVAPPPSSALSSTQRSTGPASAAAAPPPSFTFRRTTALLGVVAQKGAPPSLALGSTSSSSLSSRTSIPASPLRL